MSDVFDELKAIMRRSGLGADAIAWKAGCARATIYHWLKGHTSEPSLPILIKVAGVFGRSIELNNGKLRLVDTPASVAEKMAGAREFIGLWRRYQ
jgi:transcriptional regulator with XRE-family HTH domain